MTRNELAIPAERASVRAGRVGASEVGAVFGLDPYCTRWELWHRKAGNLPEEDLSDNDAVFWGSVLEPAVAQGVALREGWNVRKVRRDNPHPQFPFLGASLDYEVVSHPDGPGVLEIKTADRFAFKRWEDAAPPMRYQLQLQSQLACTGRQWGALAVLVGGNDLRVFRFGVHDGAIARVLAEVSRFWRSVEMAEEPVPDWEMDAETVLRLHGYTEPGKALDLRADSGFAELCRLYVALGGTIADLERDQKAAKAQIVARIGAAELAIGHGCKVTTKDVPPGEVAASSRKGYRRVTVRAGKQEELL